MQLAAPRNDRTAHGDAVFPTWQECLHKHAVLSGAEDFRDHLRQVLGVLDIVHMERRTTCDGFDDKSVWPLGKN